MVGGGGDGHLQQLVLRDSGGEEETVAADALFVLIGARPHVDWLPAEIARDAHGFLLTGADRGRRDWPLERPPLSLETSMPGVLAAGDVRHGSVKRVASAVGEGAIAVQLVHSLFADEQPHVSAPTEIDSLSRASLRLGAIAGPLHRGRADRRRRGDAMSSRASSGRRGTREEEALVRRLILQTSMSIDGYVAALDRSHPWNDGGGGDDAVKRWILDSVRGAGAHLMGRVTYEEMASVWPTSTSDYARPMNEIPKVVFSKTLQHADWPETRIASRRHR